MAPAGSERPHARSHSLEAFSRAVSDRLASREADDVTIGELRATLEAGETRGADQPGEGDEDGQAEGDNEAGLAGGRTLADLRAAAGRLSDAQRGRLVEQALVLLEDFYVHLPFKQAMHATDPLQRLRLLVMRQRGLSEPRFHAEVLDTFTSLRDLHTQYLLPKPYTSLIAFLPFLPEEFFERGQRGYLVSKLVPGFQHPNFKPGVVLKSWNGIPIERAVELNGDRQAGSNPDARLAHGLETLCFRPMGFCAPPDEDWVIVGYSDGSKDREVRLDWQVVDPGAPPQGVDARDATAAGVDAQGIDVGGELVRRARKLAFAPDAMKDEAEMEKAVAAGDAAGLPASAETSVMPDVFAFRKVSVPAGTFGYIRIWSFNVNDADEFVAEFVRIVGLLPDSGLIVDVRANPGGLMTAAEQLLQVLTPQSIEPEQLQFVNTALTARLADTTDSLSPWRQSIREAVETGAVYSQGFPLQPADAYNTLGQQYHGPVVLITDALCYSAGDIFAAGFQDHGIGPILGTSGHTGAGGANVWTHDVLYARLGARNSPLRELPAGASFTVALRRTTRVGAHSGVLLEDFGVRPDERHEMTRRDVLEANQDLIAHAGELLAGLPGYRLSARVRRGAGRKLSMDLDLRNLTRLDVLVDGRPVRSVDVTDGTRRLAVDLPAGGASVVELQGYHDGDLAASRRLPLG